MIPHRLDSPRQTLVLAAPDDGLPEVIHWGARLPDDEDLSGLAAAHRRDLTGGMLDVLPPLSVHPEASRSFAGQPALSLRSVDGRVLRPRWRGVTTGGNLVVTARDPDLGLTLTCRFALDAGTEVLTASTTLEAEVPVLLDWLAAPVLPAPQHSDAMIDVSGRWIGEFQLNRLPWTPGIRLRESRSGRSGHEHFPGLILTTPGTTNTAGEAWALHYGWSGGHRMVAEELPDGRRQIQFGHATATEALPGTRFESAPLLATHGTGFNGCATAFQRHLRERIVTWPRRQRPVHYNCWEAIYFDHDLDELRAIASRAAALGAERFVLDDGWFGRRDDDTSSLGDWSIDARKYPDGLTPLIEHVRGEGMSFGLWFEPEMVNEDSDLFRAHPDWVLGPMNQTRGRQQLVLDMARQEVRDHLHGRIAEILGANDIDYVKWDHNRLLPVADARQTEGTYALLDRLRADFPDVEIESCASGGGRIDAGILRRTQRVWLSDSNDALERLRIQHDAALFLPLAITGSHVGPRVSHTSGRSLPMGFRAWVAAQRHMGFEMDPRELTEAEAATLTRVTAWWKATRAWRLTADILRLDSADPALIAEQQLAEDGSRFVVFAGQARTSGQILPRPLRLTGLAPDARYRLSLANPEDLPRPSRGPLALKDGPVEASGAWLMHHGIALPWAFPDTLWVIEGERL